MAIFYLLVLFINYIGFQLALTVDDDSNSDAIPFFCQIMHLILDEVMYE